MNPFDYLFSSKEFPAAGGAFEATFATSALRGGGVDELREYLFDR